jgi:hypothetical protein
MHHFAAAKTNNVREQCHWQCTGARLSGNLSPNTHPRENEERKIAEITCSSSTMSVKCQNFSLQLKTTSEINPIQLDGAT